MEAHLGHSGIIPRFNTVVARGDYVLGKPNPDPFLTAAARLGIAPELCLALEDSHNGVRAASSAGSGLPRRIFMARKPCATKDCASSTSSLTLCDSHKPLDW